jgi:signal transduction histidine kinase
MVPSGPDEVTAISRDITEWKKTQQDILEKNILLEASNAEKDKFFSILAHDLRSPFNAFLGFTQLMAEELPSMTLDEIQQIAVSMRKSATNLYRLLDNLLEWSRLQRNATSYNPESFILLNVTNDVIASVTEYAAKKNISLICEVVADLTAFADLHMVETILRNMLSNAVKFTPDGGKIMISASIFNEKGVEYCITDNGIGMSKPFIMKLFKLDGSITRPGTNDEPSTGLGLIICKEFVEKHGGTIRVESEEGKGSSFFFTLPGL